MKETGGALTKKRLGEIKLIMSHITKPVCIEELIGDVTHNGKRSLYLGVVNYNYSNPIYILDGMVDVAGITKELTDELRKALRRIRDLEMELKCGKD